VSFRTLSALILCNIIWSAHPAMGKFLLLGFSPAQGAWLRYASALLSYLAAIAIFRLVPRTRPAFPQPFLVPQNARTAAYLLLLGFSAFCFSPILQMTGLASSRATDNALIVAMEPLMTVALAWLILRERPSRINFIAFGVALAGFALLTGLTPAVLTQGLDAHFLGNLLLLLSLIGEAMYSTLGRKLISDHPPAAVFGSALVLGVLCLTGLTASLSEIPSVDQVLHMPWQSAVALAWLGPFGTALSYLFWMTALKKVPVASLALTLFIQPVLGPVWGALFLGERLTPIQAGGSVLILIAVFGQTWAEIRDRRTA
jgi:drug/metabolite transporter (DMT)-like permease